MKPETKKAIDNTEQQLEDLRKQGHDEYVAEQAARPLAERLVYAAYSRCPCGAGLAYDPIGEDPDLPFKGPSSWDCSAIILGTAVPSGQLGAVNHTGKLPFSMYEIKSENQPSAGGATTRP